MTTPELSDDELWELRDWSDQDKSFPSTTIIRLLDEHARLKAERDEDGERWGRAAARAANAEDEVKRLSEENARLKATVERVWAVRARFSYAAAVPGDFVAQKLDEALSTDASTTETK